ncbi:MAG: hypothetical protein DRJ42_00240 [Deltaproteobacteria bacterium]|nr:MAG: hypothetical protein DRJ42_00240 [Deltaproteobacteria bacterium]
MLDACRWWDAAEARRQPTVYCTTEDDPVPTTNGGFPALARDGTHVAVIQVGYDCCSDFGTVSAEVRDLSNTVVAEWSLSDRDADGVEGISGQQAEARISELNALLFADGFRPLAVVAESEENLTQPLSLANGLSARLENLSFEVRRGTDVVASLAFSSYERDSDCCDGGLGRGGRCHLPPALVGVWQGERAIVVSVGLVHQRDGCDASPSFHVLSLPAD